MQKSREVETASSLVRHVEESISDGSRAVILHVVLFDPKKCALAVVDNLDGSETLGSAMKKRGALAGVNGGYFHPDHTPLGLEISDALMVHPIERARLLSGFLAVHNGWGVLWRATEFAQSRQNLPRHALQSGPFFIDRGKAVVGLESTRSASRTIVLAGVDNGIRALLVSEPVTLAEMAQILAGIPVAPGVKIGRALNLDGGSSTGMWVKAEPEPFYLREGKDVRNYLAVVPR